MTTQSGLAPSVKFSPRRMAHCNLFVSDLERSMRFYNRICGFEEVFREPHINAGFLSNGNTHHDIGLCEIGEEARVGRDGHVQVTMGRGTSAGLNHFGWEMENEKLLVEAYNRGLASGFDINRTTDHQLSHSNYVFDPDGNMHEFYADAIEDWRTVFHGGSGPAISGHWDPNAVPPSTKAKYHEPFELRHVEDALIHPVRFTHAVVMAKNFDQMVHFFAEIAGLNTVYESPEADFVCMAGKNSSYVCDIALFRQPPDTPKAVHHYSFAVADESEIESAQSSLLSNGIEIELQIDNATKRSLFIKDPDHMRCEFYLAGKGKRDFGSVAGAEPELRPYLI